MRSQWANGFNIVIQYLYEYIGELYEKLNGETLYTTRMSYHNDYDEISIFYSPPVGTNIQRLCVIDLNDIDTVSNYSDLLEDIKYTFSHNTEYVNNIINQLNNICNNIYNNISK